MKSGQLINDFECLFDTKIESLGLYLPISIIEMAFKCLAPYSFYCSQQLAHCRNFCDLATEYSLNYSHIRVIYAVSDALKSKMLMEEIWSSFSAPAIEGETLSVGGVKVRLFDEALNHQPLELAKRLVTLAGTACFLINVKPYPYHNGNCLLDGYDQISVSLTSR